MRKQQDIKVLFNDNIEEIVEHMDRYMALGYEFHSMETTGKSKSYMCFTIVLIKYLGE